MKKTFFAKKTIIIIFMILFLLSSVVPLGIGNELNIPDDKINVKNYDVLDYNNSFFSTVNQSTAYIYSNKIKSNINTNTNFNKMFSNVFVEGPWPMYCHDTHHTSQSPYSTVDNLGVEKWRFDTEDECSGSPIIDKNGVIYVGGWDMFAIYPNGTMKWKFIMDGMSISAPAIDDDGVLYFNALFGEWFYAVYSDNGTKKWERSIGWTYASPTVGPDGIIYTPATDNWNVIAFYPNGTIKWSFHANERVYSSPAIGDDGTIYCTSYGAYLYALYPENGTVKWQYQTGGSVRTSVCIADDGTIYVVSVNGVLHALYPNGTLKWQASIDGGTSPTIGGDGTIYCGYHQLYAINPDGSQKWVFNPGEDRFIREGTPCNSLDGTIYFGTYIGDYYGGELITVNPDGSELRRIMLARMWIMSAPAIGSDGTVYVGSYNDAYHPAGSFGFLHAINSLDPDAPSAPTIDGPTSGSIKKTYSFTFNSASPLGRDVYYFVIWDDHTSTKWAGPYKSGEEAVINHSWLYKRNFTIQVQPKDTENLWGPISTFNIRISNPRNIVIDDSILLRLLVRFPLLQKLLDFLSIYN
jgi:outer membrane protein assembly factor BamB